MQTDRAAIVAEFHRAAAHERTNALKVTSLARRVQIRAGELRGILRHMKEIRPTSHADWYYMPLVAPSLFDAERGSELRVHGMASANQKDLLRHVRSVARSVARRSSAPITVDDVWEALEREGGFVPADLGNAAGSIFRGDPRWMFAGYVKSRRTTRHRAVIGSWIYNAPRRFA